MPATAKIVAKVEMPDQPWPNSWRHRLRISVRALMLFVLFLGGGLGWLVQRASVQRDAVDAIKRAGGRVMYDWEYEDGRRVPNGKPWCPTWLVDRVGIDYFDHVTMAVFPEKASDLEMAHLGNLSRLNTLVLAPSKLSDRGLAHLSRLSGLRWLSISSPVGYTDTRIIPRNVLAHLRGLNLDGTDVTDRELAQLKGLSDLELLGLSDTEITDAGLAHLQGLTGLHHLFLDRTAIGDDGLIHLQRLPNLAQVHLKGTKVTDAGVRELQQALPKVHVFR